jgi:hypothetical protein
VHIQFNLQSFPATPPEPFAAMSHSLAINDRAERLLEALLELNGAWGFCRMKLIPFFVLFLSI